MVWIRSGQPDGKPLIKTSKGVVRFLSDNLLSLVFLAGALGAVILSFITNTGSDSVKIGLPDRVLEFPYRCPFSVLTGLPCPTCGLTRAFVHLARGRFAEAANTQPAALFLFPWFVLQLPFQGLEIGYRLKGAKGIPPGRKLNLVLLSIAAGLLLVVWIVRIFPR